MIIQILKLKKKKFKAYFCKSNVFAKKIRIMK